MTILFCYAGLFCVTALLISGHLSIQRFKETQRMRLITLYSGLFFAIELNYKRRESPALFQNKEDFKCFREAFKWLIPYIRGVKLWSDLSDWDMGMLVEHVIKAVNKYPASRISTYVNERILEIMTRSVALLFPVRIYLFMRLAQNNKDGRCIISGIDFTEIRNEQINSGTIDYDDDLLPEKRVQHISFSYDLNFLERFSLLNFARIF